MPNDNKLDRKQFLTLTLAVAGGAMLGCTTSEPGKGGADGSAGSGSGGTGGAAGTSGTAGASGTSGGGAGTGGTAGSSSSAGSGGNGGAGGAGGTGGTATANCGTSLKITITSNHGHVLTVTLAEITADKTKVYSTKGAADHDHFVQLTAADFTALAAGKEVRKPSCNMDHEHEFIVNCLGTDGVSNPNVGGYCGANRTCGDTATTTCPDTPYPKN
jgi:hypothetical protein